MKKVVCMVLAAVMLMACLAGCGSTTAPTPEDSASPRSRIGGTAPLTGGDAIYGNAVKERRADRRGRDQRQGRRPV